MKHLYNDMLECIPLRAIGGEAYSYECYGDDARYLDLDCSVSLIFDECTKCIYEVSIWDSGADEPELIWRDEEFSEVFFEEFRRRRGIPDGTETDELMKIRLTTTEDFDCVVETIRERFLESDEINGRLRRRGRVGPTTPPGTTGTTPTIDQAALSEIYGAYFPGFFYPATSEEDAD